MALGILAFATSSCGIKGHNRKDVWGIDKRDTRVFGKVGDGPRQLKKTYPEDETGKTAETISKIKTKLYPN